jgi:hypothetical protein
MFYTLPLEAEVGTIGSVSYPIQSFQKRPIRSRSNSIFSKVDRSDPDPIQFLYEPIPIQSKKIWGDRSVPDPIQKKFEATDLIPIRSKKNFRCADLWLEG